MSAVRSALRALARHPLKTSLALGTVAGATWTGVNYMRADDAYHTLELQSEAQFGAAELVGTAPAHRAYDGVKIARTITSPADTSGLDLRLYQYQTCPFCSKVRAFLDYYGYNYEVVEVHPVTRRAIDFSPYKKVPIVLVQGRENRQLNDSNFIVSLLKSYMTDPEHDLDALIEYYPHHKIESKQSKQPRLECPNKYFVMFHDSVPTKEQINDKKLERQWREWVDNKFIHAISPNVYRTMGESIETFRWFSDFGRWDQLFASWERWMAVYVGAAAMYFIGKRLKKRHNLSDDVRRDLYAYANEWIDAMNNKSFMGGDEPNLADLAMYGAMTAFEGCTAFADMRANTSIGDWYDSMQSLVSMRHGSKELQAAIQKRKKLDSL